MEPIEITINTKYTNNVYRSKKCKKSNNLRYCFNCNNC